MATKKSWQQFYFFSSFFLFLDPGSGSAIRGSGSGMRKNQDFYADPDPAFQ